MFGEDGDGGNIEILEPQFVVLDQGQIVAQAVAGNGGDITIDTEFLIASNEAQTVIDASSQLGVDGNVVITSPILDDSAEVLVLPVDFLQVVSLLRQQCALRQSEDANSFIVMPIWQMPQAPGSLLLSDLAEKSTQEHSVRGEVRVVCGRNDTHSS